MYRLFLFVVVMLFVAGCGGEKGNTEHAGKSTSTPGTATTPPPEGSGRAAIPEAVVPATETDGLAINLYGDEAGTSTALEVTPGKMFEIYLVLENATHQRIAALQFRLQVPEGIKLVAEQRLKQDALIIGNSEDNISIAFKCIDPGNVSIMKYICEPEEGFAGGTIYVAEATDENMEMFRGIATCPDDGTPAKLPVSGGSVDLTVK